jgi:chromosome segregation ATPase
MKFIPLRLFKYLYPVDIEKQVNTHFEETLKELTAENSDYHRQIIQLGNQIIQLAGELEATKQELEESETNWRNSRDKCQELFGELNKTKQLLEASKKKAEEAERQRECLFAKLEAHRDATRVIYSALVKLGHQS